MTAASAALGFGAQLKATHPPAEQWEAVRAVERAGFDSVWTGDHVSFHSPLYESLTLLASYAAITTRIKLGTGVYLLALRPPAIAAKITATVDVLSNGRLIFGVGVGGENPKEFELTGSPHTERGARVSEGIDVVRALWRDTPASFDGRFTKFSGVSIDPKPVQRPGPPIWVGGRSDAALRRAAKFGDAWLAYFVSPRRFRESLDKIAAQRDGRAIGGGLIMYVCLAPTREEGRATAAAYLANEYHQSFDAMVDRFCAVGPPSDCVDTIRQFVDAGVDHIAVIPTVPPDRVAEHLIRIAQEIVPAF